MFSEFSTINGHRKLVQTPMKVKMPSVASAGPESGMMMRHRMVNWPAPPMVAASSSSRGKVRTNWRSRNVPNALARPGTMTAW